MDSEKRSDIIRRVSQILASLSDQEKRDVLDDILKERKKGIPISVFKAGISGLEIITKYLKEIENKSFKEISKILNRRLSTLYTTYSKSKIKWNKGLDASDDSIVIPYHIFRERRYSVLESIVAYLKDNLGIGFSQISSLLNKDYSTIRTVYRRYCIKKGRK